MITRSLRYTSEVSVIFYYYLLKAVESIAFRYATSIAFRYAISIACSTSCTG